MIRPSTAIRSCNANHISRSRSLAVVDRHATNGTKLRLNSPEENVRGQQHVGPHADEDRKQQQLATDPCS